LLGLLNKRAEAHRQGLHDQERMLREQIRWALPLRTQAERDAAAQADQQDHRALDDTQH
jgi:hypothetical protein